MAKTKEAVSSGATFFEMLLLLFLGLKLGNVITWSWWWVFAPLWGPVALLGIVVLVMVIYIALTAPKAKKK